MNMSNLDQSVSPRCYIFSLYESSGTETAGEAPGYPVFWDQNEHRVLTAHLGFFPQSDPSATGACHFSGRDFGLDDVYYGRVSAGGIDMTSGNFFFIPYCPTPTTDVDDRGSAYRDNTDYSVVVDECGYFTTTT